MKRLIAFFLLCSAVLCAAQAGIDQNLQTSVNSANQAWIDGMRRGDAAIIAATYAPDAVNCSTDGQCVYGASAIGQQLAARIASMGRARTANVNPTSLVRDRDLAYEWGYAEANFSGGRSVSGRYLTVWQHQPDGSWKILRNLVLPSGRERQQAAVPLAAQQTFTVRCESDDMGRHTCAAPATIVRAEVLRQISGSPCTQDRTWGWQDNSIWVDRGCRAEFTVYGYAAGAAAAPIAPPSATEDITEYNDPRFTKSIRCESDDMNYRFCPAGGNVRTVRLVRQLSGTACSETRTWGWKADGVWVDKGCRAEFEVTVR